MSNVTKATTITATINLWAVPKNSWDITTADPSLFEVRAYLDDSKPYQKGAVQMPYGDIVKIEALAYDCTAEGIQALETAKMDLAVAHAIECKQIDEQIAKLTCLVHLDT